MPDAGCEPRNCCLLSYSVLGHLHPSGLWLLMGCSFNGISRPDTASPRASAPIFVGERFLSIDSAASATRVSGFIGVTFRPQQKMAIPAAHPQFLH